VVPPNIVVDEVECVELTLDTETNVATASAGGITPDSNDDNGCSHGIDLDVSSVTVADGVAGATQSENTVVFDCAAVTLLDTEASIL